MSYNLETIKARINLHQLAPKLGLERPNGSSNYLATHRGEKNASLTIDQDGKKWFDHAEGRGGSCIDLVMRTNECSFAEAVGMLAEIAGVEPEQENYPSSEPGGYGKDALHVFIAKKTLNTDMTKAIAYLSGRSIEKSVIDAAIAAKAIGAGDYQSPAKKAGEIGYGGDAVAFVVRDWRNGEIVAVEQRYIDADLNGGVKSNCQGSKSGHVWCSNYSKISNANIIYIYESAINALSGECCAIKGAVHVACMGKANIEGTDWPSICEGKLVRICMDNDIKATKSGTLPGPSAAWRIYDILTAANVAARIVAQEDWDKINDANDYLVANGVLALGSALRRMETNVISGVWNNDEREGKKRLWLEPHDFKKYFAYRLASDDFTQHMTLDREGNKVCNDLCAFRVAEMSRIQVAGATSVVSGSADHQFTTVYTIATQSAQFGKRLHRTTFDHKQINNPDKWASEFGFVFSPKPFARMVNIMQRTVHLNERRAANFVGLCWLDGKLQANDAADCFFTEPDTQCPYSKLRFASGNRRSAIDNVKQFQESFGHNDGAKLFAWAVGAHLKCILGFWPHMQMQAKKGSGKTTIIDKIRETLDITLFSGESIGSNFRILTSLANTSHPVMWDELSANRKDNIDVATSRLQESYKFGYTRRGAQLTEFIISAPVLVAGEEVDARSLTGKMLRVRLTEKGKRFRYDLAKFPMKQWIKHLASIDPALIRKTFDISLKWAKDQSTIDINKNGAERMVENYAALATSWKLLTDYCEIPYESGDFMRDLLIEMNTHIRETEASREPWLWIIEKIISEIDAGLYDRPHAFETVTDGVGEVSECLCIRPTDIMHYMGSKTGMRDTFNALPIKTGVSLKAQLVDADMIISDNEVIRFNGKRHFHMPAIPINKLRDLGMNIGTPEMMRNN